MIAVLQRQHVQKRAAPTRLKAHLVPAARGRWVSRVAAPAIPVPFVPAAARRLSRPAGARLAGPVRQRLLGVLILVGAALLVALAVVLLLPRIRLAALPLERPVLPSPPETDQDIYRMLVPEQPAPARAGANPVLAASLKVVQYKARSGESLSEIARRFKLNLDTIISWNGIRDARSIRAGTVLEIPNTDGLRYTVHRGDTLEQIARANGLPLNTVLDWNRLLSSVISPGQVLFLPGVHMRTNEVNRVLGNLFVWPVRGKISSYFGVRPDPFTGVRRFHNGLDIVNAPGTPILAAMAGTVQDVGFNNNYGYYVILRHPGYQTLYGHLTRYLVNRGQKVQQGEEIGQLGTTGYSTGPHLHFSVFKNGEAVDPLPFLK